VAGSTGKTKGQKPGSTPEGTAVSSEKAEPVGLDESTGKKDDQATPVDFDQALNEFFASPEELGVDDGLRMMMHGQEGEAARRQQPLQEYLSFRLANECYAISILYIKEIIKLPLITAVPRTESVILGILSLRGMVVPLIDLRLRLGLEATATTRKSRVLIVQQADDLIGLLVDEVQNVVRLSEDQIESAPSLFGRLEGENILGVGRSEGEMYTLLNLAAVTQVERYLRKRSGRAIP
jgi:chemotaxis signal transduction protein